MKDIFKYLTFCSCLIFCSLFYILACSDDLVIFIRPEQEFQNNISDLEAVCTNLELTISENKTLAIHFRINTKTIECRLKLELVSVFSENLSLYVDE